jgi:hypothetical protein
MLKTLFTGVATDDWTSAPAPISLTERLMALLPTWTSREGKLVERFIAQNGGVLTDSLEREISRRFGGHAGR